MCHVAPPAVLTLALPGIVLIRLATRPTRWEVLFDALVAAVVFSLSLATCRNGPDAILSGAASLGIASLLALGVRGAAGTCRPRAAYPCAALLCIFSVAVGFFFRATTELAPKTFDTYLYAFDYIFGSPSFFVGRLLAGCPLLMWSSSVTYVGLPFVLAAFCALQLANPRRSPSNVMTQFAVGAGIGWMLYLAYPAVGPIYAFTRAFPANPPVLSAVRIDVVPTSGVDPRNCMPSLHAAWALLVLWNARPFGSWVRLLAGTFLLLTFLSTLGLGEHYLIDLVVAVPFTVGVRAVCATRLPRLQPMRLTSAVVGFILTASWILALRQKVFVTGIPVWTSYALVALTVGVSLQFERRLDASIRTASPWPPARTSARNGTKPSAPDWQATSRTGQP
jgi:hypothetical protein